METGYSFEKTNVEMERRSFLKTGLTTVVGGCGLNLRGGVLSENEENNGLEEGAQRLPVNKLKEWEKLKYGMFIHFGMSTFLGEELPDGRTPPHVYNPEKLNVDQWIKVAKDAGMRYAVLTTKHVAGHCLWPTKQTDYHVGNSGNKTDVVAEFVNACHKYGVLPGFYYCSWDNHNLFGSKTSSMIGFDKMFTTQKYRDFQLAQVEELLTQYGKIMEVWIDIPGALGQEGKQVQYSHIASLQPETVIMLNNGIGNGTKLDYNYTWPTDLMAIERYLPDSCGYDPWFDIPVSKTKTRKYYIPGEVCDPIGYEWFHEDNDQLRNDAELLGMRLIAESRGVNLLLDVPPNRTGLIPEKTIAALMRLEENYSKVV
jgi:alpha-L-fucosidase